LIAIKKKLNSHKVAKLLAAIIAVPIIFFPVKRMAALEEVVVASILHDCRRD
jgi:hypothetical protein